MPFRSLTTTLLAVSIAGVISLVGCDTNIFQSEDSLRQAVAKGIEEKNFSLAASNADALIKKNPNSYEAYFFLAQAKAQTGDKNAAIVALEKSIKSGLRDDLLIEENQNLQPIRQMAAYVELMNASFPQRVKKDEIQITQSTVQAGSTGIFEKDGKTVVKAGDVVIEVQKPQ